MKLDRYMTYYLVIRHGLHWGRSLQDELGNVWTCETMSGTVHTRVEVHRMNLEMSGLVE